jgi:outer membrane protease
MANPEQGGLMTKFVAAVAVLFMTALALQAAPATEDKPGVAKGISWDLWGGVEPMSGHVTYQIGGNDGRFPVSELKWPADVIFGTVGGSIYYGKWEAYGLFSKNLEDTAGTLEDSDWEDPSRPDLKTIYSESDTDFSGYTTDGSIRYWMMNSPVRDLPGTVASLAIGLGYLYQDFSWDAKNLDQWYPQNPEFGHDVVPGPVASYESTLNMPYVEAAGKLVYKDLMLAGTLGFAPYVQVNDEDNHILRYIQADTDADGTAFKASLHARYYFANHVFLMAQVNYLTFDVDGTEHVEVYAGPFTGERWTADHNIKSDQTSVVLGAGVFF